MTCNANMLDFDESLPTSSEGNKSLQANTKYNVAVSCFFFLQACAYKIGEIKIRELREKARSELGKVMSTVAKLSIATSHVMWI